MAKLVKSHNLTHQIDIELHKGYSEVEVTQAVVKAIRPGLQIRNLP